MSKHDIANFKQWLRAIRMKSKFGDVDNIYKTLVVLFGIGTVITLGMCVYDFYR